MKNYLRSAWRIIKSQKIISLINIGGLTIGMSAAILIFIWVQNELNFDTHYANAEDIYLIKNYIGADKEDVSVWENSPYLLGAMAQERIPEVIKVARIAPMKYPVPYFNFKGEFIKEESCAYVDSSWFDVFGHKIVSGSIAAFNDNPFSLVLTSSKAKKYFGRGNPVGQTLQIDTIHYVVRAVMADNPSNSSFQFDVLIPLAAKVSSPEQRKNILYWGNYNHLTFLKLSPAANPATVENKLSDILIKERKREKNDLKAGLISLPAMHFDQSIQNPSILRGEKKTVTIFSVLGILLLAIACINYVNLTTARATLRIKEVSIRKIVGAGRKQLFAQFITESLLISFFALVIAIIVISLSLPYFNRFTEKEFTLSVSSINIWLIMGGTLLLSVTLSSIYPALLLSSFKPIAILRGSNIFKMKSVFLRKTLVVVQFALSIILIVASIVIYKQMQFVNQQGNVMNRSQLFSFSLPFKVFRTYKDEERTRFMDMVKQKLLEQSSVEDVTRLNGGSVVDMQSWSSGDIDWDGREEEFEPKISFFETDASFKNILQLQLAEGRWFLPGNADKHNSILNETAVKEFNIRQPVIGQRFTARGDTGVIVGVVKDFYYKNFYEKIGPVVIRNDPQMSRTYIVKTVPGRTMEARDAVEKVWNNFFPRDPFPYQFLNDEFEALYRGEKKVFVLVRVFSFLAIFISCLGLFGLAAFAAERRKKEIGIRKVVGASVNNIVGIISKEFVILVSIAFLIASPLAWWAMNEWLSDFAYHINIAWWMFAIAILITLFIAMATLSYHAIKAALANPVKSLRTE